MRRGSTFWGLVLIIVGIAFVNQQGAPSSESMSAIPAQGK